MRVGLGSVAAFTRAATSPVSGRPSGYRAGSHADPKGAKLEGFGGDSRGMCRHVFTWEGGRPRRPRTTSMRDASADPAREAAGPPK